MFACGKKTDIVTQRVEVSKTTLQEIETFCNEIYTRADHIERCIGKFVVKDVVNE